MSIKAALTTIAICQFLATLAIIAAAAVLILVVLKFKQMISDKMDEAMNRVQPILEQTKQVAEQAKQTAELVSEKVDVIMTKAEATAGRVTERVDNVSAKVEQAVSPQAATVAGYVTAAMKAFQVFQQISMMKNPKPKSE